MAFPAKYNGQCIPCDELISVGDEVTMVDSDRGRITIHAHCAEDGEIHVESRSGRPDHTATIPRGRTASDRCNRCFQIPASNGSCGCDS